MANTDLFLREFDKILANYEAYIATGCTSNEARVNYINEQCNILNILNKYIALSSSGVRLELQIYSPVPTPAPSVDKDTPKKETVDNTVKTVTKNKKAPAKRKKAKEPKIEEMDINELMPDENDSSKKNIHEKFEEAALNNIPFDNYNDFIKSTLKLWGCDNRLLSGTIMKDLPEIATKGMNESDFIKACSDKYNKKPNVIVASLNKMLSRADFSNSPYTPLLKKAQKDGKLNLNILLKEFSDFIE